MMMIFIEKIFCIKLKFLNAYLPKKKKKKKEKKIIYRRKKKGPERARIPFLCGRRTREHLTAPGMSVYRLVITSWREGGREGE